MSDYQTYPICKTNFMRIGKAVSEEFNHQHRDTRILYTQRFTKMILGHSCHGYSLDRMYSAHSYYKGTYAERWAVT